MTRLIVFDASPNDLAGLKYMILFDSLIRIELTITMKILILSWYL